MPDEKKPNPLLKEKFYAEEAHMKLVKKAEQYDFKIIWSKDSSLKLGIIPKVENAKPFLLYRSAKVLKRVSKAELVKGKPIYLDLGKQGDDFSFSLQTKFRSGVAYDDSKKRAGATSTFSNKAVNRGGVTSGPSITISSAGISKAGR